MLSKVISFFDRSKKNKKFDNFDKNRNYENKSMERQDDEDDYTNIDNLSWTGRDDLEKSKSNSSITAIRDYNYRSQATQISLENCHAPRNITSVFENLNLDDSTDIDEYDTTFTRLTTKYQVRDPFDYGLLQYGFKTQDISTKQLVIQAPEILNFQGNRHSPEEISPYWKKDCRMWLWKSVKLAKRQNEVLKRTITLEN